MKQVNMELGRLIKEYRLKKNFTQLDLSMKLGYDTPQFISILERGMAKVPLNVVGQLIILLGIPEKKITKILASAYLIELNKQLAIGKEKAKVG